MPGEVEVLPHPGVQVVPDTPPVLCAPLAARSGPHLPHILGPGLAGARPVVTGHRVHNPAVLTRDGPCDGPGLPAGCAGVSGALLTVHTAEAARLPAFTEAGAR